MNDKLVLNTFGASFGLADPSPFVMKVMLFLKMHNIETTYVRGDIRKAPLKKIPFIEHNGKRIPDSELIMDYLESELDLAKDPLTDEQHSLGHFICRALEERTYWCIVYCRWMDPAAFAVLREEFLSSVPSFMRGIVGNMVRKSVKSSLHGHGLGRHSEESIKQFMLADYKALSDFLADKPFLFGDQFTRYDCTAAAMVSVFDQVGLPWKAPDIFSAYPNLQQYWSRVKSQYSMAVEKS